MLTKNSVKNLVLLSAVMVMVASYIYFYEGPREEAEHEIDGMLHELKQIPDPPVLPTTVTPEPVQEKPMPIDDKIAKLNISLDEMEPAGSDIKGIKVAQHFKPTRKVVSHPDLGEIVEITYDDGTVLYEPNLKRVH